jgi:hypothetical protein
MGILNGLKNMFGKKEVAEEPARRIESKKMTVTVGEEEFVPRYKLAQKMREDKDMDTPIVKRKRY